MVPLAGRAALQHLNWDSADLEVARMRSSWALAIAVETATSLTRIHPSPSTGSPDTYSWIHETTCRGRFPLCQFEIQMPLDQHECISGLDSSSLSGFKSGALNPFTFPISEALPNTQRVESCRTRRAFSNLLCSRGFYSRGVFIQFHVFIHFLFNMLSLMDRI